MVTYEDIAGMIDHSLLKPNLTDKEIEEGCRIAHEYRVATVCVRPSDVRRAAELLAQSPVRVTTVIGFPHGSTTTTAKVFEAEEAIRNGARELDVVLNDEHLHFTSLPARPERPLTHRIESGSVQARLRTLTT